MNLIWLKIRLARAQWAIALLAMLLQRSPAIRVLSVFEKVLSQPVSRIVQATTWLATSMGVFHATAGATQFVTSPGKSPYSVNVGDDFQMTFTVTDAPKIPFRWEIRGKLTPGLSLVGDAGQTMEGPIDTDPADIHYRIEGNIISLSGQPTTPGIFVLSAQAFNDVDQTDNLEHEIQVNVAATSPGIVWDPRSMRVPTGGRAQFFFESSGEVDSIQWRKDGLDLAGETGPVLVISEATLADEGLYSVVLTNASGATESAGASLTIDDGATSRLSNLSNRGFVGTGGNIMIPGLVILGTGGKTVIVRGLGPDLLKKDVPDVLADPELKLYKLNFTETGVKGQLLASNDDWEVGNDAVALTAEMEALGLEPLDEGSKDAAMLVTLGEGVYTFQLSGVNGTTGVGLVELFAIE